MLYRLPFQDAAGHPLTLSGFKDVHDDPGFDLWRDTSTLYTRILAGHVHTDPADPADHAAAAAAAEAGARVVAAGIITIHIPDFLRQLTTFRVSGSALEATRGLETFGRLFLGDLWKVYGAFVPAGNADTIEEPR